MPRITIGVPIYNGAALIGECLGNLARQTHDDFEVIISDNASTDGTTEICAAFCENDRRFRHIVRPKTSTMLENFLYVRNSADCCYFAFRAYDDLSAPDFLNLLEPVLNETPTARLAVGTIRQVLGTTGKQRRYPYPLTAVQDSGTVEQRILRQMFKGHASWFYGLWRHAGLMESYDRVLKDYDDPWGADHLVLLHAMLRDGIRGVPDGAEFVQRVLPTARDYIPATRPTFVEMSARNQRFGNLARQMLAESTLDDKTRQVVGRALPKFTLRRCHSVKRLTQAWLKAAVRSSRR